MSSDNSTFVVVQNLKRRARYVFKGRTRILPKHMPSRIEFYSVTSSTFRHNEIFYDTGIFPVKDEFAARALV